jgi:hypothetical protein
LRTALSWSNEARDKAVVHCVFGLHDVSNKIIYEYAEIKAELHVVKAGNIISLFVLMQLIWS